MDLMSIILKDLLEPSFELKEIDPGESVHQP
jgi:hypothetical protein